MNQENFFDVRTHEQQPGQVIVAYNSIVELEDCDLKRKIIEHLAMGTARNAVMLLTKFGNAQPGEACRVCREMMEYLLAGNSLESCAIKTYKY